MNSKEVREVQREAVRGGDREAIVAAKRAYTEVTGDYPSDIGITRAIEAWQAASQPRVTKAELTHYLFDLITEQSEGEWDDAMISRDANFFAERLISAGLIRVADHSGDVNDMVRVKE